MKHGERRQRILEAYRRDPSATLLELAERTGLKSRTAVRFHLIKLEKEGLVVRNTEVGNHTGGPRRTSQPAKPNANSRQWNQIKRGEGAFKPRKARGDDGIQARIEAIVAKAKAKADGSGPGEDVILVIPIVLMGSAELVLWQSAIMYFFFFAASGTPMIWGSTTRTVASHKRRRLPNFVMRIRDEVVMDMNATVTKIVEKQADVAEVVHEIHKWIGSLKAL